MRTSASCFAYRYPSASRSPVTQMCCLPERRSHPARRFQASLISTCQQGPCSCRCPRAIIDTARQSMRASISTQNAISGPKNQQCTTLSAVTGHASMHMTGKLGRSTFPQAATRHMLRRCMSEHRRPPGGHSAHLDEADVLGALPKALAADEQAVLADEAPVVCAHAAAQWTQQQSANCPVLRVACPLVLVSPRQRCT